MIRSASPCVEFIFATTACTQLPGNGNNHKCQIPDASIDQIPKALNTSVGGWVGGLAQFDMIW